MFYTTLKSNPATQTRQCAHATLSGLIVCLGLLAAAPAAVADTGTLTTLHTFNSTDGAQLYGGLVQDASGNLYGTASAGGVNDKGVVYKIASDGTLTVLHSFDGTDGANPEAGLVLGDDGSLYGTTSQGGGGSPASGTIFKITPAGVLTTLYSFCTSVSNGLCMDGQNPAAALVQGSDGNFYGAAFSGGANFNGTIFKISGTGDFTPLYSFPSGNSGKPNAALVEGSDGNFYGTTEKGGLNLLGTVFKITPAGTYTLLYSFAGSADGSVPQSALLLASDGNFYGTASGGGAHSDGTIFMVTPSGTLSTLYAFDGSDGQAPGSALIEGKDGNFYGVAYNGGAHGAGDIFQMTPSGTLTVLHSFGTTDGNDPMGALLQTADGSFYGTTFGGGAGALTPNVAFGTVYKYSTSVAAPPPVPQSLQAVADDGAVDLTWMAAAGAASYNIYQGDKAGSEAATPVKTGITDTKITISGLTDGTTYYFTVAAVNGAGTSAQSNEASATPLAVPGQVTGLTATAGDASIKLSWTPVTGASGYTISSGTAAGTETPVATGVNGATYNATGLTNGTAYYFTVTATNSTGNGPASTEVNATPAAASTPPPSSGGGNPPPAAPSSGSSSSGGGGPLSPLLMPLLGLLMLIRRRLAVDLSNPN